MTRRTAIRIISFCAAALLLACGLWRSERRRANGYLLQLGNEYSRALSELNAGLNQISLLLEKTGYVTTPAQISSMAAELYSEAELSKTALSRLPTGEEGLDTVNRFLSQVGNYALSVSKNVITGQTITPEQKNQLSLLSDTAATVAQAVSDSQISFNNRDYWASELNERLSGSTSSGISLAASLTELEENLTDYPTLIYDGPYSDHILTKKPLMTENAPSVTREEALHRVSSLLPDAGELSFEGNEEGRIPAYRFGNNGVTVTVSRSGGYVVYMRKNRMIGEGLLSYSQMLNRAKRFLEQMELGTMLETYYYSDEGVCVINFAYLDGQTLCYTDLVKVGVAEDTGEIMLYESSGYLFNHTDRAFETPAYTAEEAHEVLSDSMSVSAVAVALIPTDGGAERRCYEFLCTGGEDREILVYIDVMTLEEVQLFILLKNDGGTLVK